MGPNGCDGCLNDDNPDNRGLRGIKRRLGELRFVDGFEVNIIPNDSILLIPVYISNACHYCFLC